MFVSSREFSIVGEHRAIHWDYRLKLHIVQQVESRARKLGRLLRGVQSFPNGDMRLKSSQYIEWGQLLFNTVCATRSFCFCKFL